MAEKQISELDEKVTPLATDWYELQAVGGGASNKASHTNLTKALRVASQAATGIVELATAAETNSGTDATRAVTPAGLEDWTGSAQVTTLGTIAAGVWNGTDVPVTAGGTGSSNASDARTALGLAIGSDVLAEQTIGISDNNLLEVDGSPNSAEYARFTANGLEGRTEAEFKGDFNLEIGTDVQAYDGTIVVDADIGVTVQPFAGTVTKIDDYTAVIGDAGKMITYDKGTAVTGTIPANAAVAYAVGTELHFAQLGAGALTIAINSDTLNVESSLTLVLAGQYAVASAKKMTATTWLLFGNLTAS